MSGRWERRGDHIILMGVFLPRPGAEGRSWQPEQELEEELVRDVIRRLLDEGWYLARQRGSHRQYRHPTKTGTVTVSGHPSKHVRPGTLKSIMRQAGWSSELEMAFG